MEKLKERIGIDKTVICEIAIKAIDKEKLQGKIIAGWNLYKFHRK